MYCPSSQVAGDGGHNDNELNNPEDRMRKAARKTADEQDGNGKTADEQDGNGRALTSARDHHYPYARKEEEAWQRSRREIINVGISYSPYTLSVEDPQKGSPNPRVQPQGSKVESLYYNLFGGGGGGY